MNFWKEKILVFLKEFLKELWDFGIAFIIALIIVIPFRHFIIEPYMVRGESMSPNFETADYILVNKLNGHLYDPARGDVLVFVPPMERKKSWKNYFPIIDERKKFIKRVVGLPGEEVRIKDNKVWIKKNGWKDFKALDEPYLKNHHLTKENTIKLKDDEYFMLGDNRGNSWDSEDWGPIKKSDILGEPVLRIFPFSTFGFRPAKESFDF